MPLSEWSEKQFLMLTAGIVGGVLVIGAGVLFYVYSTYNGLLQNIEKTDREVRSLEKEGKRLNDVKKELEEASAQYREILDKVPPEQMDKFLAQLNEQSRNAHLSVAGMEPLPDPSTRGKKAKIPTYQPIRVKLTCKGGFHDLGRFINRVEQRMERLVNVASFTIGAYKDGLMPGSRSLDVELIIETYKYNDKKKASSK